MPRLDFEKQFSRRLKDRELQPSQGSWEKLQGKLEQGEKKRSPLYLWFGVAASMAGGLLILNFVFGDPVVDTPPGIVNTEVEKTEASPAEDPSSDSRVVLEEPEATKEKVDPFKFREEIVLGSTATEAGKNAEVAGSGEPLKTNASEKADILLAPSADEAVAAGSETLAEEDFGTRQITDAEIDALLKDAIAEVSQEMPQAGEVTDAQIESLLAEARAEVRNEKVLYQTASYDAGALLQEVETELEHSFREQVFDIIRDGFRKTRNAVVNINE